MKKLLMLSLCIILLSGCSWFKDKEMDPPNQNNGSNNMTKPTKNNIEDVFTYFENEGIEVKNIATMDQFDFAAHEGRMFEVNGERVYLYRLNTNDEKINEWMNEIKQNNTVDVNQNGLDEKYSALLNQDYLLVYKKGANISPLDEVFNQYSNK